MSTKIKKRSKKLHRYLVQYDKQRKKVWFSHSVTNAIGICVNHEAENFYFTTQTAAEIFIMEHSIDWFLGELRVKRLLNLFKRFEGAKVSASQHYEA